MNPEDLTPTSDILKAVCQSRERLYTYIKLHQGDSPKKIAQDLDITRNALQHYITDWKELELIYTDGKAYEFTEKGDFLYDSLQKMIQQL